MKNLFFSAFIVLIGTGAAFATNKADNKKSAIVDGYHFDAAQGICVNVGQDCSNVESEDLCEWSEDDNVTLREFGATMCGQPLFKIPQP